MDRVQQHLRQELTRHQKEKDDYEKLIQDLALSEKEEAEQQKEKVGQARLRSTLATQYLESSNASNQY